MCLEECVWLDDNLNQGSMVHVHLKTPRTYQYIAVNDQWSQKLFPSRPRCRSSDTSQEHGQGMWRSAWKLTLFRPSSAERSGVPPKRKMTASGEAFLRLLVDMVNHCIRG